MNSDKKVSGLLPPPPLSIGQPGGLPQPPKGDAKQGGTNPKPHVIDNGVPEAVKSGTGAPLAKPRPAPPVPLSRLIGNRDWVIVLECKADSVVLQLNGTRFAVTDTVPRGQEHGLTRVVREMIERRQATVRQGEVPYRPLLRFRVYPDGLRAYYFAYPLLESLRVPMSRENVD